MDLQVRPGRTWRSILLTFFLAAGGPPIGLLSGCRQERELSHVNYYTVQPFRAGGLTY